MQNEIKEFEGDFQFMDEDEGPQAQAIALWCRYNVWSPDEIEQNTSKIIDIGCGPGTYVRAFLEQGLNAHGIDPDPRTAEYGDEVQTGSIFDTLNDRYDLVVCLEVLEHIPLKHTIEAIAQLRKAVRPGGYLLFSAAHPGQPGDGHINCQPLESWTKYIEDTGFIRVPSVTQRLKQYVLGACRHMNWFRENAEFFHLPINANDSPRNR